METTFKVSCLSGTDLVGGNPTILEVGSRVREIWIHPKNMRKYYVSIRVCATQKQKQHPSNEACPCISKPSFTQTLTSADDGRHSCSHLRTICAMAIVRLNFKSSISINGSLSSDHCCHDHTRLIPFAACLGTRRLTPPTGRACIFINTRLRPPEPDHALTPAPPQGRPSTYGQTRRTVRARAPRPATLAGHDRKHLSVWCVRAHLN